jgi:hypothetical protein
LPLVNSKYIYLVDDCGRIIGAFTVKKEAVAFIEKYQDSGLRLCRMRDGKPGTPEEIPWNT